MRTIGQVAGHEINLEIEDVLDKIKKYFLSHVHKLPILAYVASCFLLFDLTVNVLN